MQQSGKVGQILFGHRCQRIQQKSFSRDVDREKHQRAPAKKLKALDRWVRYHNKVEAMPQAMPMIY